MYVRQGFSWIQNWVMNAALKAVTKSKTARVDLSFIPFNQKELHKNDFENIMKGIFSYILLTIYTLPMYTYILRMQIEKQQGMKRHLSILGLSYQAQYLAEFVGYTIHITMIAAAIWTVSWAGNLFP